MMLRTLFLLLSCLLPLAAQTPTAIQFGTWNIEFLGADPKYRRDTPPRTDQDLQALGKKIRQLGVCVLAVQEICGESVLKQVAAAAGDSWRAVLGTTGQWSDGKTQQGIGFLYDRDQLTLLHAEELLDFPSERDGVHVFHRKPVTACLKHRATGCDFRIIVVHLKAGRKQRDKQKRRAEATTLREYVDMLHQQPGEDRDIVILGDFNCSYGDDPEHILEQDGTMRYLKQKAPTIMHFDTPIDQICVATDFGEVQPKSMVAHHVKGKKQRLAFRKQFSDHFPVTAKLLASGDDDPNATFHHGSVKQLLPVAKRPVVNATNGAQATPTMQWAPPVGSAVTFGVGWAILQGTLAEPLPQNGGWVVVRTPDGTYAIPMNQLEFVRFQAKK